MFMRAVFPASLHTVQREIHFKHIATLMTERDIEPNEPRQVELGLDGVSGEEEPWLERAESIEKEMVKVEEVEHDRGSIDMPMDASKDAVPLDLDAIEVGLTPIFPPCLPDTCAIADSTFQNSPTRTT
jgi:hypothetical protein